jgi:HSP20 family molecular chaperone IbpA
MATYSGMEWGVPAVDFVETDEVTAELPGVDEKNIKVRFADGVLTVRGEKQEEKEEKKKDYSLNERSYGSFHRALQLPSGIDEDKIEATFKKWRAEGDVAEECGGAEGGKEDSGQSRLIAACADRMIE